MRFAPNPTKKKPLLDWSNVAQASSLLYRRFPICRTFLITWLPLFFTRLADWKSAIGSRVPTRSALRAFVLSDESLSPPPGGSSQQTRKSALRSIRAFVSRDTLLHSTQASGGFLFRKKQPFFCND